MAAVTCAADPLGARDGPSAECGALTVALAHGIAAATGAGVLVIDADPWGTRLAQRIEAATAAQCPPAQRGLPTLVAARGGVAADSIERHCWTLPARERAAGRVLLAAAAAHPVGAAHTARWAARHADALAALPSAHHDVTTVLVSTPGAPPDGAWGTLLSAAALQVLAAAAPGSEAPGGVRALLAAFGRRTTPDPVTELRAGPPGVGGCPTAPVPHPDAERLPVLLGRVGPVRERALLGARPRRREQAPLDALAAAAARLATLGSAAAGATP